MKILVVLSRVPYPLDKGDKLRAFHQIRHLARQHEITLCCTADEPVSEESISVLKSFCREVNIFPLSRVGIAWRMFRALFSRKPFQVHYFHSHMAQKGIADAIKRTGPDVIFAQLIRTAEFVKHIHHIPKTLDYMDAFSKGYERRKANARGQKKQFFAEESKRLTAYEHLIFDYFDRHCIISEQDRNHIYHPERHRIAIVPNGVDFDYFSPGDGQKDIEVLFTGNMGYAPNEQAAERLALKVMPLVWESLPEAKLMIAGANPSAKVKALEHPRVIITGRIPDIRTAYSRSRIFCAPMQMGTGLQNKLLEAMAMELPCITTTVANNALGALPGSEILIGNSDAECAAYILKLLSDPGHSSSLAAAGRSFVQQRFGWPEATAKLEDLLNY